MSVCVLLVWFLPCEPLSDTFKFKMLAREPSWLSLSDWEATYLIRKCPLWFPPHFIVLCFRGILAPSGLLISLKQSMNVHPTWSQVSLRVVFVEEALFKCTRLDGPVAEILVPSLSLWLNWTLNIILKPSRGTRLLCYKKVELIFFVRCKRYRWKKSIEHLLGSIALVLQFSYHRGSLTKFLCFLPPWLLFIGTTIFDSWFFN